jgi:hypothetical protein
MYRSEFRSSMFASGANIICLRRIHGDNPDKEPRMEEQQYKSPLLLTSRSIIISSFQSVSKM